MSSRRSEWWVARLAFPLVLGGALAVSISLIEAGRDPFAALLAGQIPAFVAVIVLSRRFPHFPSWKHDRGDTATDAAHTATIAGVTAVLTPLGQVAGVALAVALSGTVGISVWPQDWPLVLQLALALVVGEFFEYWVHRLQHGTELLWRLHATHHSAPRLYWLNAGRFHPLDIALNFTASLVPLAMLGAGAEVLVLRSLFSAIHGIFQHANLVLVLGPLNWIFSMAELHRWHHSRLVHESNHNYGQNLIVWDVVFGTRYLPADREPPEDVGIPDLERFPMTYLAQLASPFRWRQITSPAGASR